MRKTLIFGAVLLALQTTLIQQSLSIGDFSADFLIIFIILFSLKVHSYEAVKTSFILGLLQDLISLSFINTLTKPLISYIIVKLKDLVFAYNFWVKSFFVLSMSLVDILIKNLFLLIKYQKFAISSEIIFYLFINFFIFYIVYLKDEDFKI